MRRYLFPLILGVVGCAVLIYLGLWQLDRRAWKEDMLADITAGIQADPVPLPDAIDPSMKYLPVTVSGTTTGAEIDVLSHTREQGAGYQIVSRFVTDDGRAILLDRGFVPQEARRIDRPPVRLQVTGNLHWPQDASSSTPAPNMDENIWFARDVDAMALTLGHAARAGRGQRRRGRQPGRPSPAGGHRGDSQQPPVLCGAVVPDRGHLGGDDTGADLAYQAAQLLKDFRCVTSRRGARPRC